MKRFLFILLLTVCGSAAADVLSDANHLLAQGSYGEAFPLYQMLANTGNAEAKLHLGQMYWYGKGLPPDRATADKLFKEAAAAGNAEAKNALTLSSRREAHAADIAKWTAYDGADLTTGKYACTAPQIGEVSKTNEEIQAIMAAYKDWSACYNSFVGDLQGPLAPAKRIPADVAVLMTEAEQDAAVAHITQSTNAAAAKVGAGAKETIARYDSWEKATKAYADEHNSTMAARIKAQKEIMAQQDRYDLTQRGLNLPPPPQIKQK
jgi:hypothetical protein